VALSTRPRFADNVRVPTDPAPRIRRAVAADLEALVALEHRSFSHDRLSRAQYRRHLASDSALVLVANGGRHLYGSAVLFFRRGTRVARLYSLATASEARGHGLGTALLDAAETAARRRRCRCLRLEVRTDNVAAIRLYERHGYTRTGRRTGYYEDGSDAWRYEKPLDG
jgi:ribosomal protein S18 acetylase RimI-like enzyme